MLLTLISTDRVSPLHLLNLPPDISDRLQVLADLGLDPSDAIDPRSPNYAQLIADLCEPELTSYFFGLVLLNLGMEDVFIVMFRESY